MRFDVIDIDKGVAIKRIYVDDNDIDASLSIPQSIEGKNVVKILEWAFIDLADQEAHRYVFKEYESTIKELFVPGGIDLSPYSFSLAPVREIVLGKGIKEIPESCFAYGSFEKIQFESLALIKEIGESAFQDCRRLSFFEWPANCKEIPPFCFHESGIEDIREMENVESIGAGAFSCTNIKFFRWPPKCKIIPSGCFIDGVLRTSALAQIEGIDDVEVIENGAFRGTQLTEFVFPKKCTVLNSYTFWDSKLKKISFLAEKITIETSALPLSIELIDASRCSSITVVQQEFDEEVPSLHSILTSNPNISIMTNFETDLIIEKQKIG